MAQVARFAKHKFQGHSAYSSGAQHGFGFLTPFYHALWRTADGAIFGNRSQPEPLLWLGGTVVAAAAWLEGRNGRNERSHQLVLEAITTILKKENGTSMAVARDGGG